MSYKEEEMVQECPICLDELDLTDRSFKPCKCGYQMCRFCWNHINENLNGRCPACRQPYKTENYKFTPPNPEEIQRIQNAKKAKERERKLAEANARKNLTNVRVIQRNLVYLTNLALSAATEEILKRSEYFGKFGKIKKIVVNRNNIYQGPQGSSVSAYITYFRNKDAHAAIKAVDGTILEGRLLRASFGTTKYCSYFLRNVRCPNPDCMYLHELGNEVDSFTKEDMAQGKHLLSNITLNPDEPGLANPKAQLPPQSSQSVSQVNSTTQAVNSKEPARPSKQNIQQNPAWKTVSESAPPPVNTSPSLNPEEWPDALSLNSDQSKKKRVTPSALPPRAVEPSPPRESPEPSPPQTKSALPSTASWASKITNDTEEEKLRDKTNLTKKNGIVNTMSTPVNRNPIKVQPVVAPTNTVTVVDTRQSTKIAKKPPVEWRKTASAPVHEDEMNNSESDSENHKSPQSNETEESDDFYDDDVDNATYDERMSRLSLNDINTSRVSDSHSEDNDTEETSSPSGSEHNHSSNSIHKQTVTEPTSTQHPQQKTNIYQDFDPNDLQGFADWLRLRFTDLLLDNSNDKNLPLNFSATTLPLLWNTPCAFLVNSLNTRSRFDFARHDDDRSASTQTHNIPLQSFHSPPPGYDHHNMVPTGYHHHHHHPSALPQMINPGSIRQSTMTHPFTNHTLPYHAQKTHI